MELSIIFVNWNVADLLVNAVQSIVDNPPSVDFEIIVVDNASSDDSILKLTSKYPTVKLAANKENVGFGKANNQGMEMAVGKYIALLNPDTVVIGDALDKLINALGSDHEIGMVGPALVKSYNWEPQLGGARLTRTFTSGVLLDLLFVNNIPWIGPKLVKRLRYPYDLNKEGSVEVISGAAMMFKASIIKEIGGFDERFFMGGEDVELCDRFRNSGYRIYYFPGAKIIHLNQSCTPQNPVDIFVNRFMSLARYYEIKNGKWTHFWFKVSTYLILIPKILIKSLYYLVSNNREKFQVNKAILVNLIKWRFVGDAEEFNEQALTAI